MCLNNETQEMGFPIQRFSDQSLFAAPRNLSQRTTSFIASQRQGIHRIPLRHLIVLEIRKRTPQTQALRPKPDETAFFFQVFRKDQFCFKHIREPAVRQGSRLVCSRWGMKDRERPRPKLALLPIRPRPVLPTRPDVLPLHNVNSCRSFGTLASIGTSVPPKPLKPAPPEIEVFRRAMRPHENLAISKLISHRKRRASRRLCRTNSQHNWWSQTGSNRRPHACKARALPTELWPLFIRKRTSHKLGRALRLPPSAGPCLSTNHGGPGRT